MNRLAWALFGAARRFVLGGLSREDRAEMDELIRARLVVARGHTMAVVMVWLRELLDLFRVSVRKGARRRGIARGGGGMGSWIRDLGVAARSLARRPAFAMGVVVTLGLGIGATTATYSVVDGVMLRPLPYDDASRLVSVGALAPGRLRADAGTGLHDLSMISMPNYLDFAERARSLDRLAALEPNLTILPNERAGPELVAYVNVSHGLLEMLGATPALGRLFLPGEYGAAAPKVVVLSHGAWQRLFGADPEVVGRPLSIVGDMTVVGVLPSDFEPPEAFFPRGAPPELWFPIQQDPATAPSWFSRRRGRLHLLGRLAEGASVEQARIEAARIASDLAAEFPDDNVESDGSAVGIGVNGLHDQTVGGTGTGLRLFLGAAGLLLLLAAMNAATLLLARSLDRSREFGVRIALGADRFRVLRLLASEAAILSVVAGALGVGLAYTGVGIFLRYAPVSIPRLGSVAVDWRVLTAAAMVSLGTGIVAGLLPALGLTSRGPWARLQNPNCPLPHTSIGLRGVLVGGQIAVAVVLLSGAALLFNSFVRMRSVDPGFDPEGLLAVAVDTKGGDGWDFQAQWIAWDRLLDELRGLPSVESVALATRMPFTPPDWMPRLLMPGDAPETIRDGIAGYVITPGYLATVGTELLEGRDFDPRDRSDSERVALVNQSFSRVHLRGENPIGATIRWAAGTEWSPGDEWEPPGEWLDGEAAPVRIVGLVEDVVQASVEEGPRPAIYVPHTQGRGGPTVVLRASRSAAEVFPDLRRAAARFNPRVPPIDFGTLQGRIAATQVLPRFQSMLVGAFALVAMLLAAAGLYASMAHSVGRRQQEMGVRMALGAGRAGVLRLVLGQGMGLATAGLAVGVVATMASTRFLASFLYGVRPNDPATLAMTSVLLLLVSAVACLAPARRATSVDPVRVLKAE